LVIRVKITNYTINQMNNNLIINFIYRIHICPISFVIIKQEQQIKLNKKINVGK